MAFSMKISPSLSVEKYCALWDFSKESKAPAKVKFSNVFLFAALKSIFLVKSKIDL